MSATEDDFDVLRRRARKQIDENERLIHDLRKVREAEKIRVCLHYLGFV